MADERLPEFVAVVTPARTDFTAVRQSGDTRDKRETLAQALSLIADGDIAESAVTQHVGALEHSSLLNVPTTISQAEAEAGVATTDRLFTAARVAQAIAALAGGGVSVTGTPTDGQIAIWTAADDLEGTNSFKFDTTNGFQIDNVASNAILISQGNIQFADAATPMLLNVAATGTQPNICPNKSDLDTGLGLASLDELDLIAGGVKGFSVVEVGAAITNTSFGKLVLPNGTEAAPSLVFTGAPTTGFHWASDYIGVSIAGDERWRIHPTSIQGLGIATSPIMINEIPTSTNPTFAPANSDIDTGMGWAGADLLSLVAGGVQIAQAKEVVGANQFIVAPGVQQDAVATPTLAFGDGDTGVYEFLDDQLRIALGGVAKWQLDFDRFSGFTSGSGAIFNEVASSINPTLIPGNTDTNTGIGWTSADIMSLIAGGAEIARVKEVGGGNQFIVSPGLAADQPTLPILAFGDGDSGFYESVDDTLKVTVGGAARFNWTANVFGAEQGAGPAMLNEDASSTNPTVVPNQADPDTGLGRGGVDRLNLIAGGITCMSVEETGGSTPQIGFYGTAPISLQTGVAVTAGGVHAALVALGLITA